MEYHVGIGEYRVASVPSLLITRGLGSCVGVVVYDQAMRVGGLAHVMLPKSTDFSSFTNPYKFADLAVPALYEDMKKKGCRAMHAKLVGGAKMFAFSSERPGFDVGNRNVEQVRASLRALGISVSAEDVGGSYGRTVSLDTVTGLVKVRTVGQGERQL